MTQTERPSLTSEKSSKKTDYQTLVRQVADKVWKMWQDELRRERERRGTDGRR